jgi:hypothetical protein
MTLLPFAAEVKTTVVETCLLLTLRPDREDRNGGTLMDANEIAKKVSQSSGELTELKAAVRQLQARVDRQALVLQVLKDMLLSRGEAGPEEFLQRLERATAEKADGRTCRKCGKAMSAKLDRCMYCGEQRPPELL